MSEFVFLLVVLICFTISKEIVKKQKVFGTYLIIGGESPEIIEGMRNIARHVMLKNTIPIVKEEYEIKTKMKQGKIIEVLVENERNRVILSADGTQVVCQKAPSEKGATILLTVFFSLTILIIYHSAKILIS